ncbi:MAG: hypothetical protein PHP65_03380, partial [Bacilli bacterium]|nr:hypothetical protein [Bacilli bacterium]
MKGFFKFLFGIFIFLVITVVVPVGILYYQISDARDEAPVDLYTDDITMQSQLAKMMARALESEEDVIYLGFNEEDLNLLLFAAIRENYNPNYYKTTSATDTVIQEMPIPAEVPVVGGKVATLRHAYAKIIGNQVSIYVTAEALGIKTSINFGLTITEDQGVYKFQISRLGVGKFNLLGTLGKMILSPILKSFQITDMINDQIEESNLPIVFNEEDFSFTLAKSDIGDMLVSLTAGEGEEPQNELLGQLIGVLTGSDNDLFGFGVFEDGEDLVFGAKINLTDVKYDALTDGTPTYKLDYNQYQTKMAALLGANPIEHFDVMSKYVINGYANLDATEQTLIATLDFTSIGISSANIPAYTGLVVALNVDLAADISNELYAELADLTDAEISLDIS